MHTELELEVLMKCKQVHAPQMRILEPSIFTCSELKSISASNLQILTVAQLVKRFIIFYKILTPVPVAARSKAEVCGHSPAEIVGSNPAGGMDVFSAVSVVCGQV